MQQTQNKLKHNNINNYTLLYQIVFLLDQTVAIPNQENAEQPKTQQHKQPRPSGSAHTTIWIKQHFFWINTYNHLDQTTTHPNQTPHNKTTRQKNRKTPKTKTNTRHFHIPLFYRNFVPQNPSAPNKTKNNTHKTKKRKKKTTTKQEKTTQQ